MPRKIWIAAFALLSQNVFAAPKLAPGDITQLGKADAPQGGTFYHQLDAEPATLNPITASDIYTEEIRDYWVCDALMQLNWDTYEFEPALAEKYEVSPDGKVFTFTLREGVTFHDGTPMTAEDVKFSFDAIKDPAYKAAHLWPYYEGIEKVEVVDPRTVRVTTKTKYFLHFDMIVGDTRILSKKFYAKDGHKKTKTMMCTGAYKIEKYDQGQRLTLVRNKEWWGDKVPGYKGRYNFERVVFRFVREHNISVEMIKKGDLDYFMTRVPEVYQKITSGPEWGKKAFKTKVETKIRKATGFIGWNLRRSFFKERDVRVALAHLMNREEMNKKFRFGMSLLATGPWYRQNDYADPNVKPIAFDPKKATTLLKKAGWADSDKDGILDKVIEGQKTDFSFTLLYANKDTEKYFTLYQEDLKKAGIRMDLRFLEWNAFLKTVDDNNFDAIAMSWGGVIKPDPKQIWHSTSAVKGGSNFIGYSNPEVDKMIDEAREELDTAKRMVLMRKVYRTIAEDAPYAFLFNERYDFYLYSNKVKMLKPAYNYRLGSEFWWARQP